MQTNSVSCVQIWSRWLRLSHWLIAFSTLGLLSTGFLLNYQQLPSSLTHEIHDILSAILLPGLLIRLYLLIFGKGTDHISDCEPTLHRLSQAWQVLQYYLTLGKAPLPKWFSHNPLWGPIYLALFFILALSLLSGFALVNDLPLLFSLDMTALHLLTYKIIAWFTLLHLIAVFAHDLGGTGFDISGMINGQRIFEIKQKSSAQTTQTIELDDLIKTLKK